MKAIPLTPFLPSVVRSILNIMKTLKLLLLLSVLAVGASALAQTTTTTNYIVGFSIPDNDANGLASTKTVSTPVVSWLDEARGQ